jgi:adenylate cyclase
MPEQPLKSDQQNLNSNSNDEMWYRILAEGDSSIHNMRSYYGLLPSDPRCVSCHVPFRGVGGTIGRIFNKTRRSAKNPRYCNACELFMEKHPGGAEIVLTMLFVDVRGSTSLAEKMSATEFSRLMNRFYESTIKVLVHADAIVDKLIGDEVTALFIPGYAGADHARRAVEAGQALLRATGYADPAGAWVPVGVGIHTGVAYIGSIASESGMAADFTALGDNVNITARLASAAGPGEVLASQAACDAAGIDTDALEIRELGLKGKSEAVNVRVLHVN